MVPEKPSAPPPAPKAVAPAEKPVEKPVAPAPEKPAAKPTPAPVPEKPAAPVEKPAEKPAAPTPAAKPVAPAEKPAAPPAKPAAPPDKSAAPAEKPAAAPADKPAAPAKKPAEKKTELENPFSQNNGGMRLWTDVSGKHQVEARFVSRLADGTVRLQRADGRYLRVDFARLAAADQQFVRQQVRALAMD